MVERLVFVFARDVPSLASLTLRGSQVAASLRQPALRTGFLLWMLHRVLVLLN